MGTFSIWHWLLVLLIVILVFGTKKLRNAGQDMGGFVRGFKQGMKSNEDNGEQNEANTPTGSLKEGQTIDAESKKHD